MISSNDSRALTRVPFKPTTMRTGWKSLVVALVFCVALQADAASRSLYTNFAFASTSAAEGGEPTAASDHHQSAVVRELERSLAKAQPLLERYGYGAVFAAVMVEGMGIPTPGQTLLVASALEAAAGRMNILLLLLLATAAAIFGNSLGYAMGLWGGRFVLDKLKLNPQRQRRVEDLFKRHGGLVIVLSRFLDGLRQLNGIVAGVMKLPWWTFTAYNVAGAILWTGAWGLATYYLGRDVHVIAAFLERHAGLLYLLGVTAFLALLLYLLRSRIPASALTSILSKRERR